MVMIVAVTQGVHNHMTVEDHYHGHHDGHHDNHHVGEESNHDYAYLVRVRVRVRIKVRGQCSKDEMNKKMYQLAVLTRVFYHHDYHKIHSAHIKHL